MKKLVLASGNKGKLAELNRILEPKSIQVIAQSEFKIPDADETGLTFIENAIIKARHAAKLSGLPALADDSGLEVDALKGAPGIYSARFSGSNATDTDNNNKLLQELVDVPEEQRTARFHCVLALMKHENDPTPLICHGVWEGRILLRPSGDNGFGYDPLFFAFDQQCASANLAPATKNKVSHRGQAMVQLIQQLELPDQT